MNNTTKDYVIVYYKFSNLNAGVMASGDGSYGTITSSGLRFISN